MTTCQAKKVSARVIPPVNVTGDVKIDIGTLTPEELANLQTKVTAGEIADFVESGFGYGRSASILASEIRRRWGSVELAKTGDTDEPVQRAEDAE